jgi:hypothetical protein
LGRKKGYLAICYKKKEQNQLVVSNSASFLVSLKIVTITFLVFDRIRRIQTHRIGYREASHGDLFRIHLIYNIFYCIIFAEHTYVVYRIFYCRQQNTGGYGSKKGKGKNDSKSEVSPEGLFEKTKPICRPSAGNPKY